MIDIDKFAEKIESLNDKIRDIKFNFKNPDVEKEADELKEEAIAALEYFLDLAQTDSEKETETEEDTSDTQ